MAKLSSKIWIFSSIVNYIFVENLIISKLSHIFTNNVLIAIKNAEKIEPRIKTEAENMF